MFVFYDCTLYELFAKHDKNGYVRDVFIYYGYSKALYNGLLIRGIIYRVYINACLHGAGIVLKPIRGII